MEEFKVTVEKFLSLIELYEGLAPTFSFDYKKCEIVLKSAPSGFLRLLFLDSKVCAHLKDKGVVITYFK